jgi:hypothetical protein
MNAQTVIMIVAIIAIIAFLAVRLMGPSVTHIDRKTEREKDEPEDRGDA